MKFRSLLSLFVLVMMAVSCQQKPEEPEPDPERIYWDVTAKLTCQALIDHYWGASFPGQERRYYFNYASDQSNMTNGQWWPQGHAMDVIIDAYIRTGDQYYLDFYEKWWDGMPRYNYAPFPEEPWANHAIDDVEWLMMTLLRMYETTGVEKYYLKARDVYNKYIITTWGPDDEAPWYGGISWSTNPAISKSKNACSNGPGCIIAARLARFYDRISVPDTKTRQDYINEAEMIYSWEKRMLFHKDNGLINDRMEYSGVVGSALSYNQGTFIGSAVELYRLTGRSSYIDDAILAANYTINNLGEVDSSGSGFSRLLSDFSYASEEEKGGDSGLFHGIFFRYFIQLISLDVMNTSGYSVKRDNFMKYLEANAILAFNSLVSGVNIFPSNLKTMKVTNTLSAPLTPHVTGCALMGAMCYNEVIFTEDGFSPVEKLKLPAADYVLKLNSNLETDAQDFSWEPATTDDGYKVQYRLDFYDNAGAKQPVYSYDAVFDTEVSLSFALMNQIADAAHIAPNTEGDLFWTVTAFRGKVKKACTEGLRRMEVKRSDSYNVPENLYLEGDAAESGYAQMVPQKLIKWKAGDLNTAAGSQGQFEIYTHLNKGALSFIDKKGNTWSFSGKELIKSPSAPGNVTEAGEYHIVIDMLAGSCVLRRISKLMYVAGGDERLELSYAGGGKWKCRVPVESYDDRYNFRLYESENSYSWAALGASWWDQPWVTTSTATSGDRFQVYYTPMTDIAENELPWQPTFKWLQSNMAFQRDVLLDMSGFNASGSVVQYSHSYTVVK